MTNTKFCTKCGEGLPATTEYFYTDKHAKSGLRPDCKICSKKRVIEYKDNQFILLKSIEYLSG